MKKFFQIYKKNFRREKNDGVMLKSKLYDDISKSEIFTEDLEYKNCFLDHTLTDT